MNRSVTIIIASALVLASHAVLAVEPAGFSGGIITTVGLPYFDGLTI